MVTEPLKSSKNNQGRISIYSDLRNKFKDCESIDIDVKDVTVVIPTLNEEESIGLTIRDALSEGFENILVVDGHSKDNTLKIAKTQGAVTVIQNGKGKAGGVATAIDIVKTPYMVVIDGDYTYNPADIKKLLDKASTYSHVLGARSDKTNVPPLNRFGNRLINLVFNFYFGDKTSDVCSGLYLIKTSYAKNLDIKTQGFDIEVELAAQSAVNKTITEVPVSYGKRLGFNKLHPFKDGLNIIITINKLAQKYRTKFFYAVLFTGSTVLLLISYLLLNQIL